MKIIVLGATGTIGKAVAGAPDRSNSLHDPANPEAMRHPAPCVEAVRALRVVSDGTAW
jgi:hypothetical protein